MSNLYLLLLKLYSPEQPLIVATVTRTFGSTPQKPGSSAVFDHNGLVSGTVGGGILESKIEQLALESVHSGKSGYYFFNLNKELKNGEDALCGGQIEILIDASPWDSAMTFSEMKESLDSRIPGVLTTKISKNENGDVTIKRKWLTEKDVDLFNPMDVSGKEIKRLIAERDSMQFVEMKSSDPDRLMFLEPIFPRPQLIIAGAGHIGKALSHIARLLDFETTVIDDRKEYANKYNLPDADHILVGNVGEVLNEMDLLSDSYVVIVTRGHKDDAAALRPCIGSEAAYIGMIGSRTKISLMRDEFIRKGWAEPREWKDIHAPIGLDIQSKSVQEIAVSIAAQLIQVKNSKIPVHV
jgi:xanthine dehydrogenase accessory factor